MKMIMLVYNEAVEEEVMEVVDSAGLKNFTRITRTHGKGTTSGTHMGTDVWPGLNNIMHIACGEEQADKVVIGINNLRKSLGKEGIKAFVMPLEQVTKS